MGNWRKSTYSGANGGDCIEVSDAARAVLVRDSKDRGGATLTFGSEAWREFTVGIKASRRDSRG
jgi:hypothetical protein